MVDHRFEGEKNLAEKLEGFDYGATVEELPTFDTIEDQTSKKAGLWIIIKGLSILSVIAVLIYFGGSTSTLGSKINKDQIGKFKNTEEKRQELNGFDHDKSTESLTLVKDEESNKVTSIDRNENGSKSLTQERAKESINASSNDSHQNVSKTISSPVKTPAIILNQGGTNRRSNIKQKALESNVPMAFKNEDNKVNFESENGELSSEKLSQKSKETAGMKFSRSKEYCTVLASSISPLEYKLTILDAPIVETDPIKIETKPREWVSFGMQYNRGNTHAGAHETPFVSSFPTTIEGGKSFGYGFFGHVFLDKRHSIRPSFSYIKNTHLQFIEGLEFQTGPTGINMELYSQELKFGLDYAFNFLPNYKLFDVKAGVGLAYHKKISLESNNYYTEVPEIVKNANELDLSPLSYKFFLALEVPVYQGFVLGLEPYVVYQKRLARFTPSTFLADQGNFNITSGMNLTLRF